MLSRTLPPYMPPYDPSSIDRLEKSNSIFVFGINKGKTEQKYFRLILKTVDNMHIKFKN
jgi:hypothetical protein